jgi:hypothetical protein
MQLLSLLLLSTFSASSITSGGPSSFHVGSVHDVHPTPGVGDFTSISAALASPFVLDGQIVRVHPGTYFETIVVDKAIWLVSSGGASVTTIDGSASGTVVTITAGATVEGFSITDGGGFSTNCGGVRITSTDPVALVDNVIHANHAMGDAGVPAGGVSIFHDAQVLILGNDIHTNTSYSVGGIFAHAFAEIDVINTTIRANGGVYTSMGETSTTGTGGVLCGASGRFVNTRITGNLGSAIGGLYFAGALGDGPLGAELSVVNCTIAGNFASAPMGSVGGVFLGDGGEIEIKNSIVYYNTGFFASNLGLDDAFDGGPDDTGLATLSYSHFTPLPPAIIPGPGMITFGPGPSFVGLAPASPMGPSMAGDYHLLAMSPEIDAGSAAAFPADATSRDLGGTQRVIGSGIEMGAYEFGTGCGGPEHYGFGKPTSLGGLPYLTTSGVPSVLGGSFSIHVQNGIPLESCTLILGRHRDYAPFALGTLFVGRPFVRGIKKTADALGKTTFDIAMTPGMSGTTRYYQAILHDPGQSDGTVVALSNAIEVTFCD